MKGEHFSWRINCVLLNTTPTDKRVDPLTGIKSRYQGEALIEWLNADGRSVSLILGDLA